MARNSSLKIVALAILGTASLGTASLGTDSLGTAADDPYLLVDNFTAEVPSFEPGLRTSVDFELSKQGLASARFDYQTDAHARRVGLSLPQRHYLIPGEGTLSFWLKGDNSETEIELFLYHADEVDRGDGLMVERDRKQVRMPRIKLDFDEWREFTFDVTDMPERGQTWWHALYVYTPRPTKKAETPEQQAEQDAARQGTFWIDEMRFTPAGYTAPGASAVRVIGRRGRMADEGIELSVDLRSFVTQPAEAHLRLILHDRNDNRVADRDIQFDVEPGGTIEKRVPLTIDNLDAYLPPLTATGQIVSPQLAGLPGNVDLKIVVGTGRVLFDDCADPLARWFTSGLASNIDLKRRHWMSRSCDGELQRAHAGIQTAMAITRVAQTGDLSAERPAGGDVAPGPFAMRLDFVDAAAAFTALPRYLPGNAYRMGFWVRGDGSGATLHALLLDYTDSGDFWHGGWKRITNGERQICTLDFTGWRYFEVPLPGQGIGSNTPTGSTVQIDFPLELTALKVLPARDDGNNPVPGHVLIGPMYVETQQPAAQSLVLNLGYDDPTHSFRRDANAHVVVQNSSPLTQRKARLLWSVADRMGEPVVEGEQDIMLAPGQLERITLPLAASAEKLAGHLAPLRLSVEAYDTADVGVSVKGQLVLSRPDSDVYVTGFEAQRDYLGLSAYGVEHRPEPGEPVAATSTEQAHDGQRSLAIPWQGPGDADARKKTPEEEKPVTQRVVSVDPPLPGVPVELSLWVHGDGSGALFYPIIGDRSGVNHGGPDRQFDLFLTRVIDGQGARDEGATDVAAEATDDPLRIARPAGCVRIDWTGWRELRFRLPVIPPTWDQPVPVLGWVPSYPLGLHLAIDASDVERAEGTLYVDDIRVRTHLPPPERLRMLVDEWGPTNALTPDQSIRVTIHNDDTLATRSGQVTGGLYGWQDTCIAGPDADGSPLQLKLQPGERRQVTVADKLPPGAYQLRLALSSAGEPVTKVDRYIIVGDMKSVLGDDWLAAMARIPALRSALGSRFHFLQQDWDWIEYHPGNWQLESLRRRLETLRDEGADPWALLGYSPYWAAGPGYRQMVDGAFTRLARNAGQAVDVFMIPEESRHWEAYCLEMMRGAGRDVAGWVLWNNPDSTGPQAVPPKKFTELASLADRWRDAYCPDRSILIGGMSRETAVPYIEKLREAGALAHVEGVNVRLDVGRLSPEDARLPQYVRRLSDALGEGSKRIVFTELDWAVERDPGGISPFDQAAYLLRSDLLMQPYGIRPVLEVAIGDMDRLGLGLCYRRSRRAPPVDQKLSTLQLKPAWWAVVQTRRMLDQLQFEQMVDVRDTTPDRTRCALFSPRKAGRAIAYVWRNDAPGWLDFSVTAVKVHAARDGFETPVSAVDGSYPIGKMPVRFELEENTSPAELAAALAHLRVRDTDTLRWPQRILAAIDPAADASANKRHQYQSRKAITEQFSGRNMLGDEQTEPGLRFEAGGSESFRVTVPEMADLILRKRFLLDEQGHKIEVLRGDETLATWDLARREPELSGGLRRAALVIPREQLGDASQIELTMRYPGGGNTLGWSIFAVGADEREFPLSAMGAIHCDQNLGYVRLARNIVGSRLVIGEEEFDEGIGVFAQSLLEYPIEGQFTRFTATVGIDAATEGRGSVTFELLGDGRELWSSGPMSGLDPPKPVDVGVTGVRRLRLIVTDAGDGNKYDAANWCNPLLHR